MFCMYIAKCKKVTPNILSSKYSVSDSIVEPPNDEHSGGRHFVHCLEVVPSSEVLPSKVPRLSMLSRKISTNQGYSLLVVGL